MRSVRRVGAPSRRGLLRAPLVGPPAVLIMLAVLILLAVLVPVVPVEAAPRPTVDQVRRQVAQLREQAEATTERFNALNEKIASVRVQLAAARDAVAAQQAGLEAARRALGRVAADQYKAGDLASVALFLSDDPSGYLDANGVLVSLEDRRVAAVRDLQDRRRKLVAALTTVDAQEQRLRQDQAALAVAKRDIDRKLRQADDLLARLTGGERRQVALDDAADDARALAAAGVDVPPSGKLTCDDVPTGDVGARVSAVLAYACGKLGNAYRYGGAGPTTFDCSGLVMMSWRQAGVSLPHNAAQQAGYGTRVPVSQLRAGDVVFFSSPIGHNGIYLGKSLMLHAPHTGSVIKIAPVSSAGRITAAVRY